jgi:hypothetical protein
VPFDRRSARAEPERLDLESARAAAEAAEPPGRRQRRRVRDLARAEIEVRDGARGAPPQVDGEEVEPPDGRSAFGIGYNRLIGAWIRAHYVLAGTITQGTFRRSTFRPATAGPS